MKTKYLILIIMFMAGISACEESKRFEIGYSDSKPPQPPRYFNYEPLYGGARIYFQPPADRDLLSIDAVYYSEKGKKNWFSVSYYVDSIDVYGFSSADERTIQLYAVDRAGNKSEPVEIKVNPLEPAVSQVASTVYIKRGFASFYVNWENVLQQNINIYVDLNYTEKGVAKERHLIYTSNAETERRFIRDLDLTPDEKIRVKIRVEDRYGNITEPIDMGEITLMDDMKVPKTDWSMPLNGDSIAGVPQAFLSALFGRPEYLHDDIVDDAMNQNSSHTYGKGRTGNPADGNVPYNIMIDLGDYYELSRIVTNQRYANLAEYIVSIENTGRLAFYRYENIGQYRLYLWDEDIQDWDTITTHKITYPTGLTEREYRILGFAGDMAYMYPDEPQFTRPTRWIRYEALSGFDNNYTSTNCNVLSEITLYAKKK